VATTALLLPGWDVQSIIATDELTGGWFAQLWRNGSKSDPPEVWVNTPTAPTLHARITAATGAADADVAVALDEALGRMRQRQPW